MVLSWWLGVHYGFYILLILPKRQIYSWVENSHVCICSEHARKHLDNLFIWNLLYLIWFSSWQSLSSSSSNASVIEISFCLRFVARFDLSRWCSLFRFAFAFGFAFVSLCIPFASHIFFCFFSVVAAVAVVVCWCSHFGSFCLCVVLVGAHL